MLIKQSVSESERCPTAASCNIITPSGIARTGMTAHDAISTCMAAQLPGIPFFDKQNQIVGSVTVKRIMITSCTCIPEDVRKHAHLLGDYLEHIDIPIAKLKEVLTKPVEHFVSPDVIYVGSNAPIVKLLALMHKFDKSYIFIMDEGRYLGAVTIHNIAHHVMEYAKMTQDPKG